MSDTTELPGLLDAGISTFMGIEHVAPTVDELTERDIDIGILGIPFDSTCLSRTGTNRGPNDIREMSCQTHPYHFEYDVRIDEAYSMVDFGDVQALPGNAETTIRRGQETLIQLFEAAITPVVLGGDHSISIAGITAIGEEYDNPGLIVLDTHLDTAQDIDGERYNHACPVARAIDEAGIDPERICLLGISGTGNPRFEREYAERHGINVFPLDEIVERGPVTVAREAVDIAHDGTDGVYLSVDIDVLDAAYAPGTGVPSPAGMTSRELLQILGVVASEGFTAMDVVETSPAWDDSQATSVMVCRIISDCLAASATEEANGVGTGAHALRNGQRPG